MGRPTKQGIDYFPMDTEFDDDLQLLIAEVGAEGLGILLTVWQSIYKGRGYYIISDEKFPLKIKQKCFSDVKNIINTVEKAVNIGIFDISMFKNYNILTSRGIQKRYFDAAKKKLKVEFNKDYVINGIDVGINGVDVGGNDTKVKVKVKVKKNIKTLIPKDFTVSDRVKKWATEKGHIKLGEHLECFKLSCTAKGYQYIDWDSAFMNAIRNDWAKVKNEYEDPYSSARGN